MTTWNPRANDLFLQALEICSPGEREEYLDRACAGDDALRAEVASLLDASARAGDFLETPAGDLDRTRGQQGLQDQAGSVIGPYKLLEQIGEGGFGIVFMAEQTDPVRRKVALKVLKPGMDTRQVVARFEAERQALAIMDHPNIARVFDGGATASGRPYFVMELVKGVPITDFCDQNHLTPRQRLELDGDADGTAGGDRVNSFFRLFGDGNGDKKVDARDVLRFVSSLGSRDGDPCYLWYFDYDGNGVVGVVDLVQFARRVGR
jgi:hypothetical protein